ncbi:MAG: hypothetical protein ABGX84_06670 [Alcanivorax sp.]
MDNNVLDYSAYKEQMVESYRNEPHSKGGKDGGGPGGPDDMEQRVANLEQVTADMRVTLARIDERTESIEKHGATKADLAGVETSVKSVEATMIKWFVGTAIALSGVAFAAATIL